MVQHLKRYAKHDTSDKGTNGIPLETLQNFPEFVGNPFINKILLLYINKEKQIILPEQFLYLCAVLSPKADIKDKREREYQGYIYIFKLHTVKSMPFYAK